MVDCRETKAVIVVVEPGDLTRYEFVVADAHNGYAHIASVASVPFNGYTYEIKHVVKVINDIESKGLRLEPEKINDPLLGYMESHSKCDKWTALAACDAIAAASLKLGGE